MVGKIVFCSFLFGDSLGGERKLKLDLDSVATDLVVVCVEGDYGRQVDV